jgi:hypothetical protein
MRWFWRADVPTVVVDSLLEGSLIGLIYLSLATFTRPATPLPLAAFWLAAATGLALARLSARRLRLEDSVPLLVVLAGVGGWYVDRGVGWLLGAAFLRGALHVDSDHESDVSVDAAMYALPGIAFAMVMHFGSGARFVGPVLIASLICVVGGMLAIGRGRQREFESVGPVARRRSYWPLLAGGLGLWTAVAIPVAYVVGTLTLPLSLGPARSIAAASRPFLEAGGDLLTWFLWQISQLLPQPGFPLLPTPKPAPSPAVAPPVTQVGGAANPFLLALWTLLIVAISLAVLGLIVLLCLVLVRHWFGWRRALERARLPEPPPSASGHPPSPLARARTRLARPRPHRRKTVSRNPASAVEAYLALLDELADLGLSELARSPTETPLDHAHRVGEGLEPVPLALLAADYQLATYGRVDITDRETARALARWRRLRVLIQERQN